MSIESERISTEDVLKECLKIAKKIIIDMDKETGKVSFELETGESPNGLESTSIIRFKVELDKKT